MSGRLVVYVHVFVPLSTLNVTLQFGISHMTDLTKTRLVLVDHRPQTASVRPARFVSPPSSYLCRIYSWLETSFSRSLLQIVAVFLCGLAASSARLAQYKRRRDVIGAIFTTRRHVEGILSVHKNSVKTRKSENSYARVIH